MPCDLTNESLLERCYRLPLRDLFALLASSPQGLTEEEARQRLNKYGKNVLHIKKRASPLIIFLK